MTEKPRIAVLIREDGVAGWQRFIVEEIIAGGEAEIALVVEMASSCDTPSGSPLWTVLDRMEMRLSTQLFRRVHKAKGIDLARFAPGSAADLAPEIARLRLNAGGLSAQQRARLEAAELDVILDLAGTDMLSELSALARHGVWALRDRAGGGTRTHPLGFAALAANAVNCLVRLEEIAGADARRRVLRTGRYGTFRWSWTQNALLLQHKSALMMCDALRDLAAGHPIARICKASTTTATSQSSGPGAAAALVNLARCGWRMARESLERILLEERWRILLMHGSERGPDTAPPLVIEPPTHSYWADPFAIRQDGRLVVFFEEYLYAESRGIISCVEIDESGATSSLRDLTARSVIDQPYHMSYPFLFRYRGALFMLPETSANKTIEVWRCVDFPFTWRREKVLFEGLSAADNTLLQHEGCWWLFTNLDRSGMQDHRNELHIFRTDDPLGSDWTPHLGNPVLVDSRRARMAGGFLRDADGALLRCSQVQGRSYGEALALNRIETLNETTYAERPAGELTAFAGNDFTKHHHIAYADGVLVADGCTYTSRLARKLGLGGSGRRGRPELVALGRAAKRDGWSKV